MSRAPAPAHAAGILALALIAGAPAAAISPGARHDPTPTGQLPGPAYLAALEAPESGAPHVQEPAAPAEPAGPGASEDVPANEPLTESADPPRPHPLRAYEVPPARSSQWGFTPEVTRWLPLVEAELATLRARRLAHPELVPELVLAVIAAESAGDPLALSEANAVGLMQLLPSTFSDMIPAPAPTSVPSPAGDAQRPDPPAPPDPFDPILNVRAGILYLRLLLVRHDSDVAWAVAGYHAGINASARARWEEQPLFDVTLEYVSQVLTLREQGVPSNGAALWASLSGPPPPPSEPRSISAVPDDALLAAGPTETETETDLNAAALDAEPPAEHEEVADLLSLPAAPPVVPPAASPSIVPSPTSIPAPVSPAAPMPSRTAVTERQPEREDGRTLAERRTPAAASPSPSPTPTATVAPSAPTASPSPTRSQTTMPTTSPTVAAVMAARTATATSHSG